MTIKLVIELKERADDHHKHDVVIDLQGAQYFADHGITFKDSDSVILSILTLATGLVINRKSKSVQEATDMMELHTKQLFNKVTALYAEKRGVAETTKEILKDLLLMSRSVISSQLNCKDCPEKDCPLAGKDGSCTLH